MEVALIRRFVPANGGATIERRWVDERGHPASLKISIWAGQPPPGAEGPGGRGGDEV